MFESKVVDEVDELLAEEPQHWEIANQLHLLILAEPVRVNELRVSFDFPKEDQSGVVS